ncbi:MAG: heme A synthase [Deltaproteobacteria bacterium]|nr:heme A synthase [Deltaproteobacteria bacterium]
MPRGYARLAWASLGFTLFVILWGAFVRATGSGAGCGSHWPLCNGEVVPRAPALATVIELTHRLTSGVALLLVAALAWLARRRFEAGHPARRAANWSLFFMVTEALIGAGLVLFEYVADDARVGRGAWVAGHLLNTFLLVAAQTLCAAWASGLEAPSLDGRSGIAAILAAAFVAVLVLAVSGAITALGDTLFPAATLAEAKAQTVSPSAHLFVRLRIWHPTLAVVVGILLAIAAAAAMSASPRPPVKRWAGAVVGLYALEMAVGLANVWWLAPVSLQLVHLLLADLIWIALLLLAASTLAREPAAVSLRSVVAAESRA